jgi:hypothetical protein
VPQVGAIDEDLSKASTEIRKVIVAFRAMKEMIPL